LVSTVWTKDRVLGMMKSDARVRKRAMQAGVHAGRWACVWACSAQSCHARGEVDNEERVLARDRRSAIHSVFREEGDEKCVQSIVTSCRLARCDVSLGTCVRWTQPNE